MSDERKRWNINVAIRAAEEICECLDAGSERLIVAGSVRRQRPDVGDVEILYVPKTSTGKDPLDLFAAKITNLADMEIAKLESAGLIEKRLNILGNETFGEQIKLMVHCDTGLPVDLFSSTIEGWWSYLVCRTGPKESNVRICEAAQRLGWKFAPYIGFQRSLSGENGEVETRYMASEQEVFEFVGLPYFEPKDRR